MSGNRQKRWRMAKRGTNHGAGAVRALIPERCDADCDKFPIGGSAVILGEAQRDRLFSILDSLTEYAKL